VQFDEPTSVVQDLHDDLIVSDYLNYRLYKIVMITKKAKLIFGPTWNYKNKCIQTSASTLCIDNDDNSIWFCDPNNHIIGNLKQNTAGRYNVRHIIGTIASPGFINGDYKMCQLHTPWGLTIDKYNGTIYFSERTNNAIRIIDKFNKKVSTLCGGTKIRGAIKNDCTLSEVVFLEPYGIALDSKKYLGLRCRK